MFTDPILSGAIPALGPDTGAILGGIPAGFGSPTGAAGGVGTGAAPLWQKILTGSLFGAGELGNIISSNKQNSYQNFLLNLLKNPGQLAAMINKVTQPLSGALVQNVNNQVQANMASRGLSQAPGIFAGTEAQALAPYVQQEQSLAQQAVLSSLGLPGQVSGLNNPQSNLGPALAMFLKSFGGNTPFGGSSWNPNNILPPQQTQQQSPGLTYAPGGSDPGEGGFTWPS